MNLKQLERALQEMKPRSVLYELVKREMQSRGRWKAKGRGRPMQAGSDPRRKV